MIIFILILLFQLVQIILTVQIVRQLGNTKQLAVNVPVTHVKKNAASDDPRLDAVIAALESAGINVK